MAEATKIEWCDKTASPWYGCSRVHAGCQNCYAEQLAKRNPGTLGVWGPNGARVKSKSFIGNLRKWNAAAAKAGQIHSVFPSMCDPFEQYNLVEWREFSEGYRVSIYGEVQSRWMRGGHLIEEWRPLAPSPGKGGYVRVNLGFDGENQTKRVHCLVLSAFLGPCPDGLQVRHLDGNPANNMLWNLAYGTSKENHADRIAHGTAPRGTNNGRAALSREQAMEIKAACAAGESRASVAKRFGVTASTASKIARGKLWSDSQTGAIVVAVKRHAAPGQILDSEGNPLFVENSEFTAYPTTNQGWRHPATLDDLRREMFQVIDECPNLRLLLLTKRPENIKRMWGQTPMSRLASIIAGRESDEGKQHRRNVWLLTSISNQETADTMIPPLLECRDLVPVLGVSAEPLLGEVDLGPWIEQIGPSWRFASDDDSHCWPGIDWVIVGGESGHGARPFDLAWARSLRDQCKAAGVPYFFKQAGSHPVDAEHYEKAATFFRLQWGFAPSLPNQIEECTLKLRDPKGGDMAELPEDLRVREWPTAGNGKENQ